MSTERETPPLLGQAFRCSATLSVRSFFLLLRRNFSSLSYNHYSCCIWSVSRERAAAAGPRGRGGGQGTCLWVCEVCVALLVLRRGRNIIGTSSRVAQRKRAGPITQRSMDRNHPLLAECFRFFHGTAPVLSSVLVSFGCGGQDCGWFELFLLKSRPHAV